MEEKVTLSFDTIEDIKNFIHENESSFYAGKNVDGEDVHVMLQQGEGMEVRTLQKNGWTRVTEYDKDGFKEIETFDGRWNKE